MVHTGQFMVDLCAISGEQHIDTKHWLIKDRLLID